MLDFDKMKVAQLREAAGSLGISGFEKAKKAELLKLIMDKINPPAQEDVSAHNEKPHKKPVRKASPKKSSGKESSGKPAEEKKPEIKASVSEASGKNIPDKKSSDKNNHKKNVSGKETAAEKTSEKKTGAQKNEKPAEMPETEAVNAVKLAEAPGVANYDALDSGKKAEGILEIMADGYGFLRSDNYSPGENDIYLSSSQIKRYGLKTGDIITGNLRIRTGNEKFAALHNILWINGIAPEMSMRRRRFEDLTPIFPNERIHLERMGGTLAMRVVDLLSPIGKGQRGMIVSPPKAGKTTLLKDIATSVTRNHPDMQLIILLIDERPEEVTDIKESIEGEHVEVIYSTFDEQPEHHKRVSELTIERAKRLVEQGRDVMVLLDSITRLSRAYNLVVAPSGRTLSGGLDPTALYMPKKFFGAARNVREGGSLTVLATALVDTGSRMDDVVFEEFKGTGNMELVLDRKLSERRIFPAIDMLKSGTRRDDLLLTPDEYNTIYAIRKAVTVLKPEDATEKLLDLFSNTKNNREFLVFAPKKFWN